MKRFQHDYIPSYFYKYPDIINVQFNKQKYFLKPNLCILLVYARNVLLISHYNTSS